METSRLSRITMSLFLGLAFAGCSTPEGAEKGPNGTIAYYGQVEFIGPQLRAVSKPDRADDRSFYMNLAMNGLTKEGYEVAAMASDDVVMRKSVSR